MPVLSQYKSWVKQHPSLVAYFESGLSTLSYLLPDRFQNTEYVYECLNSFLGLASIWHTSILKEDDPNYQQPPSALWLAAIQQVETLVEIRAMHLERMGKMSRYGPLAVVELMKAALRLHILSTQSSRLLVNDALQDDMSQQDIQELAAEKRVAELLLALKRFPTKISKQAACNSSQPSPELSPEPQPSPAPTRITATASTATHSASASQLDSRQSSKPDSTQSSPEPLKLSQLPHLHWWQIPVTPQASSANQHPQEPIRPSPHDQHTALLLVQTAELLHIYRPLVYVLLLHKLDRRSWTPWLVSLATDLTSSLLLSQAATKLRDLDHVLNPKSSALYSLSLLRAFTGFHWTSAEQRELARRKMQLAMYLLRSPCFEAATGRVMYGIQRQLQRVPLIGSLGDKLVEIVEGLQQYYTYTSAS